MVVCILAVEYNAVRNLKGYGGRLRSVGAKWNSYDLWL